MMGRWLPSGFWCAAWMHVSRLTAPMLVHTTQASAANISAHTSSARIGNSGRVPLLSGVLLNRGNIF